MNYQGNSKAQSKLMPEVKFSPFTQDSVKSWPESSYSRYKNTYCINETPLELQIQQILKN